MTTIEEIQRAILSLPDGDYAKLREWFTELDGEKWDRQIEEDAVAGRLDWLAAEVLEAEARGELRDL